MIKDTSHGFQQKPIHHRARDALHHLSWVYRFVLIFIMKILPSETAIPVGFFTEFDKVTFL